MSPTSAGAAEPDELSDYCPALPVPRQVADIGLEYNLFTEVNGHLVPTAGTGPRFVKGGCALAAAQAMAATMNRPDYHFPDGFEELDLEAASRALASVVDPIAQAVTYYADTQGSRSEWRLQSAEAYPLFAEFVTRFQECRTAIDSGHPLRPVLSELTKLDKGQLRRFGKLRTPIPSGRVFQFSSETRGLDPLGMDRARRYSLGNEITLEQIVSLAKGFDTGWIPGDETAWRLFLDIASACVQPLCIRYSVSPGTILGASKGNWARYHAQLAASYGHNAEEFDRRQLSMATSDVLEMVDDLTDTLVLPAVLGTILAGGNPLPHPTPQDLNGATKLSFTLLTEGSNNPASALFSTTRKWMSRIPALTAADAPGTSDTGQRWNDYPGWPRLAPDFQASNGTVVKNLTMEEQLREESLRLSHCVGRLYVRKAKRGECHIFSVRDANSGQSISTFEVAPPKSGTEAIVRSGTRIVQHKARKNRKPDERSIGAATEWLEAVHAGSLDLGLEEVLRWQRKVSEESSSQYQAEQSAEEIWSTVLGTNWQEDNTRRAVWREWSSNILPKRLARSGEPQDIISGIHGAEFMAQLSSRNS